MMKTDRHRTALACVAGGSHVGGCFRWRCFPRVPAIAGCILKMVRVRVTLLLDNVAISGSCMFLVLNGPHVRPLLFHMSVFYWHTCRVAVGSRVISPLDYVSHFYWSTWSFLIRPHVTVLSIHVLFFIRPRGLTTSFHLSDFY